MTLLTLGPASRPLFSTSLTSGIVGPASVADAGLNVEGAPLSGEAPKVGSAGGQATFATELEATLQSLVRPASAVPKGGLGSAAQGVPDPVLPAVRLPVGSGEPLALTPSETGKALPSGGAVLPRETKTEMGITAPRDPTLSGSGPVTAQFSSGFPEPSDVAVPGIIWATPRARLEPQGERLSPPLAASVSPASPTSLLPEAAPSQGKAAVLPEPRPDVAIAKALATPGGSKTAIPISPEPTVIVAQTAKPAPAPQDLAPLTRVVPGKRTLPSVGTTLPAPRPESLVAALNPAREPALKAAPTGETPEPVETDRERASAATAPPSSSAPLAAPTLLASTAKSALVKPGDPDPTIPVQAPGKVARASASVTPQGLKPTQPIAAPETPQTVAPLKTEPVSSAAAQESTIKPTAIASRRASPIGPSEPIAAKPPSAADDTVPLPLPLPMPSSPSARADSASRGSLPTALPLSAPPLVAANADAGASTSASKQASLRETPAKTQRSAAPFDRVSPVKPERTVAADALRVSPVGEAASPAVLSEGASSQLAAPSPSPSPSAAPSAAPSLPAPATPSVASAPVAVNPAPSLLPAAAPLAATASAANPASVEQFIEQISEAREAGRAVRPELTVRTGEFGNVGLRIDPSTSANFNDWRATLVSRDPGFVPAVQAALAERAVMAASESGLSQNGAFSQRGGEQNSQNSGSQNSTSNQSPSGSSAGFQGGGAGQDPRYGSSTGGDQGSAKPYSGEEAGNGLDQAAADTRDTPSSEGSDGLSSGPGGAQFA